MPALPVTCWWPGQGLALPGLSGLDETSRTSLPAHPLSVVLINTSPFAGLPASLPVIPPLRILLILGSSCIILRSVLSPSRASFLGHHWPQTPQKTQPTPGLEGSPAYLCYWAQKWRGKNTRCWASGDMGSIGQRAQVDAGSPHAAFLWLARAGDPGSSSLSSQGSLLGLGEPPQTPPSYTNL